MGPIPETMGDYGGLWGTMARDPGHPEDSDTHLCPQRKSITDPAPVTADHPATYRPTGFLGSLKPGL